MSMNPGMMEIIAEARVADFRKEAAQRTSRARGRQARYLGGAARIPDRAGPDGTGSARRSMGWFLVNIGLRLVLSSQHPVSAA